MANVNDLSTMKLGETINIEGRNVTRVAQKNGKLVWSIGGWICRSPKSTLSWIAWDKRQQAKHGQR